MFIGIGLPLRKAAPSSGGDSSSYVARTGRVVVSGSAIDLNVLNDINVNTGVVKVAGSPAGYERRILLLRGQIKVQGSRAIAHVGWANINSGKVVVEGRKTWFMPPDYPVQSGAVKVSGRPISLFQDWMSAETGRVKVSGDLVTLLEGELNVQVSKMSEYVVTYVLPPDPSDAAIEVSLLNEYVITREIA